MQAQALRSGFAAGSARGQANPGVLTPSPPLCPWHGSKKTDSEPGLPESPSAIPATPSFTWKRHRGGHPRSGQPRGCFVT